MKHEFAAAAVLALAASGSAAAGGAPDLQPALYAQLTFGHANAAPALHLGAQWSWGQHTLDGLAARLDPDAFRDPETQAQTRRSLRDALPPVLHLDWSSERRFDARINGASVVSWRPAVLRADGEEGGGWSTRNTWWTVGAVAAGVAIAALAGGGGGDDAPADTGTTTVGGTADEPCNVVGVPPAQGCEVNPPGGG